MMARNRLDLRIAFHEMPSSVSGSATYRMSLFQADDIRALVAGMELCLTLADRDPAITVERLCAHLGTERAGTAAAAPLETAP